MDKKGTMSFKAVLILLLIIPMNGISYSGVDKQKGSYGQP